MSAERRLERYGAYRRDDPPAEDGELTHVGRRRPAGEYLRRFWQPVAMSSELSDMPLRLRILGEDLVLFRDRGGRLGLLDLHCSHRGTSLEFGIVTERGLSCCYHGWLYDIDGAILDTPGEPPGSRIKDSVVHPAYPVREQAGLIFAYLGPPEEMPALPVFDAAVVPGNRPAPYSLRFDCNWLQVHENGMDPIHSVFLHTRASGTQFTEAFGVLPVTTFKRTRLGMMSTTVRRCGDTVWIRGIDSIMPNLCQFGLPWEDGKTEKVLAPPAITRWIVPIDDTACMTIGWRHFNERCDPLGQGRAEACGKEKVDFPGQTPDRPYDERQREPGDWDAQTSQRPIAIHALEHLGTTDVGVAMLRQLLRRDIRAVAGGERAPQPPHDAEGVVATFAHDTVLSAPRRNDDDNAYLAELGRAIDTILVDSIDLPQSERPDYAARRIRREVLA